MIVWKTSGNDDVPEPTPGLNQEFDQANNLCDQTKAHLDEYLNDIKT